MSAPIAYTGTAKVLHWVMAVLVLVMVAHGWSMDEAAGAELSKSLMYHAIGGATVLGLLAIRFVWRLRHAPPALPGAMSRCEHLAATVGHWSLYGLLMAVPVTGALTAAVHETQITVFGLDVTEALSGFAEGDLSSRRSNHSWAIYALLVFIFGHIGAALFHEYFLKDGLLSRMFSSTETSK